MEVHGERQPQREGQDGRGDRHRGGRPPAPPDEPQVEIPPDGEHEQHETELADLSQDRHRVGWKERARRIAGQRAQQRRSQQDARRELADHPGLAEALEQQRAGPRRDKDHRDVQQDPAGRQRRIHPCSDQSGGNAGSGGGPASCEEHALGPPEL